MRTANYRQQRSVWVKPLVTPSYELGEFRLEEGEEYLRLLRVSCKNFDELLKPVESNIKKNKARLREAIPAKIKFSARLVDFFYLHYCDTEAIVCPKDIFPLSTNE